MAYSSSYCKRKMNQYRSVYNRINGLSSSIDKCSDCINGDSDGASVYVEKLKICGKSVDDGKLSSISADVANILDSLVPLKDECKKKINEWEKEYKAALFREMNPSDSETEESDDTESSS